MTRLDTKIPPPAVFLVLAAAMWSFAYAAPAFPLDPLLRWSLIGACLALALVTAPWAFAEFGRARTTFNPVAIEAATSLVTTGPFRVSRNPMYVGLAALLTAWAFYLESPWTVLGPIIFVIYITLFQIIPEERALDAKFGPAYDAYRARVRRWL